MVDVGVVVIARGTNVESARFSVRDGDITSRASGKSGGWVPSCLQADVGGVDGAVT